jgi:hypothetical protein
MRSTFRLFHRLDRYPNGLRSRGSNRVVILPNGLAIVPVQLSTLVSGPVPIGAGEKKMIAPARRLISVFQRWSRAVCILAA